MLASLAQEVVGIDTPGVSWRGLLPMLVLVGGALAILVVSAVIPHKARPGTWALAAVLTAVASMATAVPVWLEVTDPDRGPFTTVAAAVAVDGFTLFFTFVIGAGVVVAALLSDGYLRREGLDGPDFYALLLLSASGGLVMAAANDLIVVFLGLEILSIAVYILAAMHTRRIESQEAGIKYFVLGAFSSAFFLYGIALVYGATGHTNFSELVQTGPVPDQGTPALLLAGFALMLVGFGFKVALVPFHFWQPDVYQGSPTPVVAYMASAVKAAGFAGLLRVFYVAFDGFADDWQPYIYGLAVVTLVAGAVLAVVQTDVKRMLAYSSISHAGFILVGLQAASSAGIAGALFYLAAYTFMVAGSFGVIAVLSRKGDAATSLDDFKGLARREPILAFVFTVFLLAQAGVPLTSGFFAKFYVVTAAIGSHSTPLALAAMVSAVIAAFLYLRIVVGMYGFSDEDAPAEDLPARARVPLPSRLAIGLCFVLTLLAGFFPGPLVDSTTKARPTGSIPAVSRPR
ncbi:MAG: NADH-quinone oxidoreductase subunit N [Acidimicrobiia bacterium]